MVKNKKGHFKTRSSNDDYRWLFQARQYGYRTIKVKKTNWDLRTCCIRVGLGTGHVPKEVRKLRSNRDAMLGERLGIEPHETCHAHVFEEGLLVVIRHIFPIGVVLAVLAK